MLRCLREYQECAAKVNGNDLVKGFYISLRNGRECHHAGVVDDDVHSSICLDRLVEELPDFLGIAHIRLDCQCLSVSFADLVHNLHRLIAITCVVHQDCETIRCQPFCDAASDAAGRPRNDCRLGHDLLLFSTASYAEAVYEFLNLFLCPSTRGYTPDSSQASCHPPRNPLETSLRRDPPASRLANLE